MTDLFVIFLVLSLLVAMIVFLIIIVRQFPQPWRGAVDAGVVAGLSYGMAATVYFSLKRLLTPSG